MKSLVLHITNDALLKKPEDGVLEISPPGQNKVRARRVVTRSRARGTGKYPSWKIGRMVQWESPHELNAFRLLDANPAVLAFAEQPAVIVYRLQGETYRHYPDAVVATSQGSEFWEVKSSVDASSPELIERTRLLAAHLPAMGYGYRMVLGEDLSRNPRLRNVLTILRHGRRALQLPEREALRQILDRTGFVCWGAAKEGLLGQRGRSLLARSFLEGSVVFDVEQPLGPSTRFASTGRPSRD